MMRIEGLPEEEGKRVSALGQVMLGLGAACGSSYERMFNAALMVMAVVMNLAGIPFALQCIGPLKSLIREIERKALVVPPPDDDDGPPLPGEKVTWRVH